MPFKIKRIYDEYKPADGWRVLVDRIWLRGISKKEARLNQWVKELAPSTELREWYCHIPEKFDEFTVRYQAELKKNILIQSVIKDLLAKNVEKQVTLLYSARDTEHNQAIVLCDYLNGKTKLQ